MRSSLAIAILCSILFASQGSADSCGGYAVAAAALVEPDSSVSVTVTVWPEGSVLEQAMIVVRGGGGSRATTVVKGQGTERLEIFGLAGEGGDEVEVQARMVNATLGSHRAICTTSTIVGVPVEVVPAQSGLRFPIGLTKNSSALFWAERWDSPWSEPGANPEFQGRIWMADLDGSDPQILASDQRAPVGIAADDAAVYWTNFGTGAGDGSVMKYDLGSGALSEIAGEQGPTGTALLVQNGAVYWSSDGIMTSGSEGPVVLNPIGGINLVTDGANLFWTRHATGFGHSTGQVVQMPITEGEEILLATGQPTPWGIQTDGAFVYWANQAFMAPVAASINRVPIGGGTSTTLVKGSGQLHQAFAIGATELYYTDFGFLFAVPLEGGPTRAIARLFPWGNCPHGNMILVGDDLYWTCVCSQAVVRVGL